MRGVYTIEGRFTGASGAKTLLYLESPATAVVEVLSANLTNMDNDTSEQLEAGLFRVTNKGSVAGSGINPYKHESGDAASSCIGLVNCTVEPTTYNSGALDRQGFNNLAGYRYDPIPEERPTIPPTGAIGLRLINNATTTFTATVQIVFREIG